VDTAAGNAKACVRRELGRLQGLAGADQLGIVELGRGLQRLSLTLAAEVQLAVDEAVDTVLRRILLEPPDGPTLERVARCLRRDVAERCCGYQTCYRALRVTATAAAAVATSHQPVAGLAAHADPPGGVLPPLGIGLTGNCPSWPPDLAGPGLVGPAERSWVDRALDAVAGELDRELSRQFTFLGQAAADLIADSLDHDLLLI
jgi:hypothetical protein